MFIPYALKARTPVKVGDYLQLDGLYVIKTTNKENAIGKAAVDAGAGEYVQIHYFDTRVESK